MKYLQEWVTTDLNIQVRSLEDGATLPAKAAFFTKKANKLLGIGHGSALRLVKHVTWASRHDFTFDSCAVKVVKHKNSSDNEVLYVSADDFMLMIQEIRALLQLDKNNYRGIQLQPIQDNSNFFRCELLTQDQNARLCELVNQRKTHEKNIQGYEKSIQDEKKKLDLCNDEIAAILNSLAVDEGERHGSDDEPIPPLTAEVRNCFGEPDERLYRKIKRVIDENKYSYALLARLEIALEELKQVKTKGKHTTFIRALKAWGLISNEEKSSCDQVCGNYNRLYDSRETDPKYENIKNILSPLTKYTY